jgi:hypothetical protein
MDNDNQQPTAANHPNNSQGEISPIESVSVVDDHDKTEADLTNLDAQSILAMHNLQATHGMQTKLPTKLIVAIVGLIVFAIVASLLVSSIKPGATAQSSKTNNSFGIPNQANTTTGSGTTNQINQDVKSCSNPVNAATVC